MKKVSLLGKIAELFGKEVSEEMAKEFQDELNEFKKLIKANRGLEDFPNLELETFEIKVGTANQIITNDYKTKFEHKRVLGVFLTHRVPTGGIAFNRNSRLAIQIDRNFVFNQGLFHYTLLEKTEDLTIYETAWRTNIDIRTSDVRIEYHDGGTTSPPYTISVHFICQK